MIQCLMLHFQLDKILICLYAETKQVADSFSGYGELDPDGLEDLGNFFFIGIKAYSSR